MKFLLFFALSTLNPQLSTLCHAQGSLTPSGAPGPVMKTLDQVEARTPVNATTAPGDANYLFKITQPGSYYLTGNLAGVAGKKGIGITAAGVVLDLNGFTLSGPASQSHEDGISVEADGVSVRHGTISGWRRYGLSGQAGAGCSYSRLTCIGNGLVVSPNVFSGGGMHTGNGATAVDCNFVKNNTYGLIANSTGITVTRCNARGNGQIGLSASGTAAIDQCTASENSAGFDLGTGCVATRCSAYDNLSHGFETGGILVDCTANANGAHGILATSGAKLRGCAASFNTATGITAWDRCTIENCTADSNESSGIVAGTQCALRDCLTTTNKAGGIAAGIYAMIGNCTAMNNGGDGIAAAGGSVVKECTAMKNGTASPGAGIHVTGSGSRIEGNTARDNTGIGIFATAGDIIIRNTSGVNTLANYAPSSGNGFAPIQSPATQTHPNANF